MSKIVNYFFQRLTGTVIVCIFVFPTIQAKSTICEKEIKNLFDRIYNVTNHEIFTEFLKSNTAGNVRSKEHLKHQYNYFPFFIISCIDNIPASSLVSQFIGFQRADIITTHILFYIQYKWEILVILIIFTLLLIGFLSTSYYNLRIHKLMKKLESSEYQLRIEKESLERSQRELKQAKEEAEQANNMKSVFISNMSHEIRTPLNAILGFSNIIVSQVENDETQKEYVDIINTNSRLLLQLINDILDLSHLESGKVNLMIQRFDVVPLLGNIVQAFKETKSSCVNVIFSPPVKEYHIESDMMRLQQVVLNLLTNADKFTQSGHILLTFTPDDTNKSVVFEVTDTGCGIPEGKEEIIFERFEKLDNFIQGTGLGLSICKMIISKLGGDIWLDKNYKEGARFMFSIPTEQDNLKIILKLK